MSRVGAKRVPRTEVIWVTQQNWGYGHGWEDVSVDDNYPDGRRTRNDYRENQGHIPVRLISRRVPRAGQSTGEHRTRASRTRRGVGIGLIWRRPRRR